MTSNKYSFSPQKNFISSFHAYLTQTCHPHFIINHPAHFCFLAQTLPSRSLPSLTFLSPENAVAYLGVRWWLALMEQRHAYFPFPTFHILDCQDNAGLALAALRLGQKNISFTPTSPQFQTIQERAALLHGHVYQERPYGFSLLSLKFDIHQAE